MIKRKLRTTVSAIALAAAITCGCAAKAAETSVWSTVGVWTIVVDHTIGNNCAMVATYPGTGTSLRAGFDTDSTKTGYLAISNPAWTSLREEHPYQMRIDFGGHSWQGTGYVRRNTLGTANLVLRFSDFAVLNQMGDAANVQFFFDGAMVANLDLGGSYRAQVSMSQCQIAAWTARGTPVPGSRPADPFARAPRTAPAPRDPFINS